MQALIGGGLVGGEASLFGPRRHDLRRGESPQIRLTHARKFIQVLIARLREGEWGAWATEIRETGKLTCNRWRFAHVVPTVADGGAAGPARTPLRHDWCVKAKACANESGEPSTRGPLTRGCATPFQHAVWSKGRAAPAPSLPYSSKMETCTACRQRMGRRQLWGAALDATRITQTASLAIRTVRAPGCRRWPACPAGQKK